MILASMNWLERAVYKSKKKGKEKKKRKKKSEHETISGTSTHKSPNPVHGKMKNVKPIIFIRKSDRVVLRSASILEYFPPSFIMWLCPGHERAVSRLCDDEAVLAVVSDWLFGARGYSNLKVCMSEYEQLAKEDARSRAFAWFEKKKRKRERKRKKKMRRD